MLQNWALGSFGGQTLNPSILSSAPQAIQLLQSVPQQLHWHIAMKAPMLSEADVTALVAFLGTLTDESLKPRVPVAVPSGLPVAPDAAASSSVASGADPSRIVAQPASMSSAEEACHTCPH